MRNRRQRIGGAGLALILAMASGAPVMAQIAILARHAEKADTSVDPDLSAEGQARAQALASALADAGITHVITTPFARTRQTAGPAAVAAGVMIVVEPIDDGLTRHVENIADAIRAAGQGAVVLVVGHSNTVPEIARALGDPSPEALKECDFDRLVVLRLHDDAPAVVRARYGAPSDPC